MTETLFQLINKKINDREKITVLCIGTDRVLYDAYGPIIGYILKNVYNLDKKEHIEVIGDIKSPVHALNLKEVVKDLNTEDSLIIAVDAALTDNKENHMNITIREGSIKPGSVFNKELPHVGEIGVKGIIYKDYVFDTGGHMRLGNIIKMAEDTSEIINEAISKYLVLEKQFKKIGVQAKNRKIETAL